MIASGLKSWGILVAASVVFAMVTACDGGVTDPLDLDSDGGGGSTLLSARFVPEVDSPTSGSVTMIESSSSGGEVTIAVVVTDVDNFFGADLTLVFDPARVEFRTATPGTALGSPATGPALLVNSDEPGSLVIAASRSAAVGTLDIAGTLALVHVTFRPLAVGDSGIDFDADATPSLLGGPSIPIALIGIGPWSGGTIQAF